MNEKIKQLAEQADWRFSDKITGDELQPILDKRLEEFARLIVAECALLCDNHGNKVEDDRPNKDLSSAAFDCSDIIKQHFGVEE
jgi:hypothetical protein